MKPIAFVIVMSLTGCSGLFGDAFDGLSPEKCKQSTDGSCADASATDGNDAFSSGGFHDGGSGGSDTAGHDGGPSGGTGGAPPPDKNTGGSGGRDPVPRSDGGSSEVGEPDAGVTTGGAGGIPEGGDDGQSPPSCRGLLRRCGASGIDDCCGRESIPGGAFTMGRDTGTDNVRPAHLVHVSPFGFDRYEVTVERVQRFIASYDGWRPQSDEGALPGRPGTGWRIGWNELLPPTSNDLRELLKCEYGGETTYADQNPLPLPMNCLNWYVAYAFCIWDGGRLPTEAEWEFAAAGGTEQRTYAWGDTWNKDYANFATGSIRGVGKTGGVLGRSLYRQFDLIGNVWEWTRDVHDAEYYAVAAVAERNQDPVNLFDGAGEPAVRGGSSTPAGPELSLTYARSYERASQANASIGVRCAWGP